MVLLIVSTVYLNLEISGNNGENTEQANIHFNDFDSNYIEESYGSSYLTINDFTWSTGKFYRDQISPMQVKSSGGYTYDVSVDQLHVLETGDTFDSYVAIYATIPVTNGRLIYSYEARATAGHQYAVSMGSFLIDPSTLKKITNDVGDGYSKMGGYETEWNYAGFNISVEGYSELILYYCYSDAFSAVWNQEFWVRNLKIYTEGETELASVAEKYEKNVSLNWTVGSFERATYFDMNFPLTEKTGGTDEFGYTIDGNEMYFSETGVGTDDAWIGAYTTLPVNNSHLAFSFEGKAKATSPEHVSCFIRIFETGTLATIGTFLAVGIGYSGDTEIGFHYFEVNQTLTGYDEVILLFYYADGDSFNNHHEFWIRNFHLFAYEADDSNEDDTTEPTIISFNGWFLILGFGSIMCLFYVNTKKR